MIYGLKVYVSRFCVEYPWVLPQHQFFEWEEKDIPFCRKYKIGHAGPAKPTAYQIGNTLVVHPDIYDQIKKELPEPELRPFLPAAHPFSVILNSII
jgi:hypothetical protein